MIWSCQLTIVLHTHTDSNGVVREQRETISSLSVIKQWRHPPRWPGQRAIERFWKDPCFTVAVIDNVIRNSLRVSVCACLYVSLLHGHVKGRETKTKAESTIVQSTTER